MTTTVSYTDTDLRVPAATGGSVHIFTWADLPSDGVGQAAQMPEAADRTIQFTGTFDSSTVVFEGSLDGTNYFTLTDPQGNGITKAAAAGEAVTEIVRYVRPRVSVAGGGSTAITAILMVRR